MKLSEEKVSELSVQKHTCTTMHNIHVQMHNVVLLLFYLATSPHVD